MTVMIITTVAVAFFALLANNQYKHATNNASKKGLSGHGNLTSYWLFVFICIAILAIVAGLRYYVGTDYGSYYKNFTNWSDNLHQRLTEWDEPMLALIAKIISIFTDDGAVFIFVLSALTVTLFLVPMAKYTDDFFFVVMMYIFTSCWSGCFNGVRQFLAAAIIFAGHRFMYERKFVKFCLVVFLAASTHVTALVMLPIYFIVTTHLDLKKILFILVSGLTLVYSYDILFDLIGIMKDSETGGSDTNYAQREIHPLRIAIAFAPIVLYFFLLLQKHQFTGEENFYMGFIFVRAAIVFGTANSAYLNRAGIYFTPFIPLSLCYLLKKFDQKQRNLLRIIILVLYAIVWLYIDASDIQWQWIFDR